MEIDRLNQEKKQISIALGAIEKTIVITEIKSYLKFGTPYHSEQNWSFQRPDDLYSQAPHTAKVVNGQVVEVDSKPVKSVIFYMEPPTKISEKGVPQ
jgi:hypothetical protein